MLQAFTQTIFLKFSTQSKLLPKGSKRPFFSKLGYAKSLQAPVVLVKSLRWKEIHISNHPCGSQPEPTKQGLGAKLLWFHPTAAYSESFCWWELCTPRSPAVPLGRVFMPHEQDQSLSAFTKF